MNYEFGPRIQPSLPEKLQPYTQERRFLKGKDIAITKSVILKPHDMTIVPVRITMDSLPAFNEIYPNNIAAMRTSTRSRHAQRGLDVDDKIALELAKYPEDSFKKGIDLLCRVTNWSERASELDQGTNLFRFIYWNSIYNNVRDEELKDAIRHGAITIHGEWKWWLQHDREGKERIRGIFTKIQDEWTHIPEQRFQDDPIKISDTVRNYRSVVSFYHKPVPEDRKKPVLMFAKTPPIKLEGVEGILSRHAVITKEGQEFQEFAGWHINSLFVDDGSDWPVIVEIYTPNVHVRPEWVGMEFAWSTSEAKS